MVLPAFNEAENLPSLFRGLIELSSETDLSVLLVDDGSTDGTASAARRFEKDLPVTVLVNERNLGLGETFARGMLAAIERCRDGDVIVCMDADDSHRPANIPALLELVDAGADVAIASRYRTGARVRGVPAHRKVLARGLSVMFRIAHPVRGVRDYSTSFRAYRRGLFTRALGRYGDDLFDREGFGCMVALLLRLCALGAVFAEAPVDLRYDCKRGGSKMPLISTISHNLRVLLGAAARTSGRRD